MFMRIPQRWFIDPTMQQLQQHPNHDPTFKDKEHFIRLKCNLYGVAGLSKQPEIGSYTSNKAC
jgi:hypothetical protein